jgi:DNA invertase Pin-like site-specific DNA recombinase
MVDDFREGHLEDVYLIIVTNFDRFSRARRSTAEDRLEDLNAMGISVWGIDNQQVASPADSLEERFAAGMTLFVAHHVRNLINRAMRKGYRAYLERQRRGELEPGERPIGGRTHVLTPDEIANVRRRRRYGAPKKVILQDYINRIPRFSKMKYETWLAVMKRQEIK